jgi:hypothetical protein
MVKSEVGCRLEITPYLTVSDAEMTGFHEEVKNLKLKIPRGTPWKGWNGGLLCSVGGKISYEMAGRKVAGRFLF